MKITRKYKTLLARPIAIVVLLSLVFIACKKESVYYNYENKVKEFDGSVLGYLQHQEATFDSLLLVLELLPELKQALATDQVTLFAPTNQSFQAAIKNLNIERREQGKSPLYLKDCDPAQLEVLTSRYILPVKLTTEAYASFVEGALYPSLKYNYPMHVQYNKINASGFVQGGPQSVIYSDPKNTIFNKFWQRSNTNAVNILTKNGVINILAPLHDYGFNEFIARVNQ